MERQEKIEKIRALVIKIEDWAFTCGLSKEVYRPELEQAWQELNKYLEENI